MKRERFGHTVVETHDGWVLVRLPAGGEIRSLPEDNNEYIARAHALGFNTANEMNEAHDREHAWLAHVMGLPVSPALYAVAYEKGPSELTGAEEEVILALHRYRNLLRKAGLL